MRPFSHIACTAAMVLAPLAAQAQDSPILTITHEDAVTSLTLEELTDMAEARSFTTSTIWTEGPQTFEGVPLAALLETLEISAPTIVAQAINDYAVEIPLEEITQEAPLVAYQQNGQPMSRRDKGPLWLVYPYDSDPDYQTEVIYSRSIWQMDRLSVKE